ncbi:TPA: hypothetical protein G5V04_005351 [Salmonella enterica]|nr:hypothetical protein [Salmonella enterica]
MADNNMTFSNTLMQPGGEDFLRELTEFMLNRIMEADVTQRINAERHECSYERETYRNGYRAASTTPGPVHWSCVSRSCVKAHISRPSPKPAVCRRKR